MFDVPAISAIVTAASVIAGVLFAVIQFRNLVQTRQTDLIMRLFSDFRTQLNAKWLKLMSAQFKGYEDFSEKYSMSELVEVGMFYEGLGVLASRKLVDIKLFDQLFGSPIIMTWEKFKPVIEGLRRQFGAPSYGWHTEYLYNRLIELAPWSKRAPK